MSQFLQCDGIGMTSTEAMGEKQDMQALNDKLASYIQYVRQIKSQSASGSFSSSSYSEAMKQLESELLKLKSMYESELQKLRSMYMDANREKNKYAAEASSWGDAKAKLAQESSRVHSLEVQLGACEKTIAEKQKEISQLKVSIKQYQQEAGSVNKYITENEQLRRKLAEEMQFRKNLEVKLKQLMDKHQFEGQMHGTQKEELQERVRVANELIVQLEAKMKKLNIGGENVPVALQKLREGNLADMRRFQKETEAALARNMSVIKRQMSDSGGVQAAIVAEKRELEMKMREYSVKVAEYQSKCKALAAENMALKKEMESERASAQMSIASLQKKLSELQGHLMCYSKEFVNAREAQASLRTEIKAYEALLDVESGRLLSRPQSTKNGFTFAKTTGNHQQFASFGGSNSEAVRAMKELNSGRISARSLTSPRAVGTPRSSSSRAQNNSQLFYGKQPKPGWR